MAVYFTLPKIMLGRKLSLFPYRQDVRTLCLCFSVEIKVWVTWCSFGSNHYPSDPQSEFRIKLLSLAVDQMVDELFADLVLGLMVLSSYEDIVNAWFVRRAYGRPLFNH
ncbi:hypothetical protein CSKR_108276 [Clonorchis sinensis]|uniref:Uncharacterized protein n=1 Tax=Clonorchis sinensis TaxID=79923 RepID=A0A3R7CDI2_CLOSI|nr:hypothetical protein CSKR_108276 [Clonorchis sinensis]